MEPTDIYGYLRAHARELGERILEMYPPLQSTTNEIPCELSTLLRTSLPAQAIAIGGLVKRLRAARAARLVAECGAGKTYMALGVAHVLKARTILVMCPSHIAKKWAREAIKTIPYARTFLVEDMRNGGDPKLAHGVSEVRLRRGRIVYEGMQLSLAELRQLGRSGWPTPRSWEMASNVLSGFARRQQSGFFSGTTEIEAQLLEGTIGEAATTELVAFLRLFRQLPSVDEILLNPDAAPLPDEPSARIAIATALGRALTDHSIPKGIRYLDRMPTEMRVLAMRDAAARDRAITQTPEFVRFGVEHAEVLQ